MRDTARCGGYLLLPVTLMLAVVAAVAYLLVFEGASGAQRLGSQAEADAAEQIARAGLHHALWLQQESGCPAVPALPTTALGEHSYSTSVSGGAGTSSFSLGVDQDAWIRSDNPDQNNGGSADQHIRFESGIVEQALYRFDLSPLAAGATVHAASAWFFIEGGKEHAEGPITVHSVTANWTELAVTWNSLDASFDSAALATIPAQPQSGIWVEINLTAQVQAWLNGQPNDGILLASSSEGVHAEYVSREGAGSERPRLDVVVSGGAATPVNVQATGTLASGVTRTLSRSVALSQRPNALTLQPPGNEVQDTYLKQDAPTKNFGVANALWVEHAGAGAGDTSLLQFDLGVVPLGASVRSASLELFAFSNATSAPGGSIAAHRVDADWDEGTGNYQDDEANWDRSRMFTNWSTPGGSYDPAPVASTPIPVGVSGWYAWDVTALVNDWLSGKHPNRGLILVGETPETLIGFRSSDASSANERPKLTLRYSCPCASACLAPRGSGKVLLVVDNPFTPPPGDQFLEALFENWGYSVSLFDDDSWSISYNWALANNDVVYVSESAKAGSIGTKLTSASIGVVSEEGELNDELAIASSRSQPVGSSIDVTDNSHYITSVFPSGSLSIYHADMQGTALAGTEAPGLQTLATFGAAGALAVLDAGATSVGGGSAAGRRVLLPLGGSGKLSWGEVNGNGLLILQRALEWGRGGGFAASEPAILLATESDATLGGLNFTDNDLAAYDAVTDLATLYFDGSSVGLAQDIDAIHVLANGHILLSTASAASLGGISFADGDLVDYDPASDTAVVVFDEGLFAGDEDIASVHVLDNGHLVLSTTGSASLGGLSFSDEDLVEYDVATDTATLFLDGSSTTIDEGIDAVHVLANGHIVLSADDSTTLGGLSFDDGDLVDYDPATDTATLYFDETLFASNENLVSVHIGPGSGALAEVSESLLLVVVDPGNLTAQEAAKQSLIESWGFGVSLIDVHDSQGAFDAAVAGSDVVFITEDINSGDLGTKLVAAAIGVVTEEANLSDEFGMASSIHWASGSSLDIDDNSHYITSPFSLGSLPIASGSVSLADVTGSLAPDLLQLASSADGPALVAIDAGADILDGRTAAGRRVQLPWGGDSFDLANLLADGRTLMRRALEWGAGSGADAGGGGGDDCAGSFADDFETDDYAGSTGTLAWANDWQEYHESDGPSAGDEQVRVDAFNSFVLRVRDNDSGGEGVWREADLSPYTTANLGFRYWRVSFDGSSDYVVIEGDSGGGYTEIGRIEGPGDDDEDEPLLFSQDISGLIAANTRLRFRTSSTLGGSDELYIDDVEIQVSGCAP